MPVSGGRNGIHWHMWQQSPGRAATEAQRLALSGRGAKRHVGGISARCNSISAVHRLQARAASEDAGAGTSLAPSFFVLAVRLRTEKISRRGGTAGRRGFSVALVHDDTASRFVARRDLLAGPRDATMTGGSKLPRDWRLEAPRRLFFVRWMGCSGDAMLPRRRPPPEGWLVWLAGWLAGLVLAASDDDA